MNSPRAGSANNSPNGSTRLESGMTRTYMKPCRVVTPQGLCDHSGSPGVHEALRTNQMAAKNKEPGVATKPILPATVPNTPYQWARGVRAGRWVFATGQCGTDYVHALAPEVLQSAHPLDGPSKAHREAKRLFSNI